MSIGICEAFWWRNFSFCLKCCCRRRSIKRFNAFDKGQSEIDKHLDIRNMLRMSYDIKAFKDTLLRPQQRMLFSKQARRYVALDESSPVVSQTSGDEEYQVDVFIENRT